MADVSGVTVTNFSPLSHDLVLVRGDSVDIPLRFGTGTKDANGVWTLTEGWDLTGVEFAAQVRTKEDAAVVMVSFTIVVADQSDPATKGRFNMVLSYEDAEDLVPSLTPAKWDLQARWPGARVKTYLSGACTIKKDVTRV